MSRDVKTRSISCQDCWILVQTPKYSMSTRCKPCWKKMMTRALFFIKRNKVKTKNLLFKNNY